MNFGRPFIGAWSVRLVSLLTGAVGLMSVLSGASPALNARLDLLDAFIPLLAREGANLAVLMLGFTLLILAYSLWNRKRTAWLLTVILLLVLAGFHLLKGLDYIETIVTLALAAWLIVLRRHFHARSDPPSVRRALLLLAFALSFTLIYGTIGFSVLDAHFTKDRGAAEALSQTVTLFFPFDGLGIQPVTRFGFFFIESIYVISVVSITSAVILLSRSVILRQPAQQEERERARQIIEQHGRSSLARLALLEDKAYYFSDGGSVVAFVAKNNIGLALGDPIGPPEDVEAAVRGFRNFCRQNGWRASFYQVLPDHVPLYRKLGLRALEVGHEAIVDLHGFTLSGNARKSLRQHVNRMSKRGYVAKIHEPPFDDELYYELQQISDEWLAETKGTEKRFALGWFYEDYIQAHPLMCVYEPDGTLVAFANLIPEYQRNEATIDLMRHRADMETGVMDFMFVSLFNWAKEQGCDTFNLGLAILTEREPESAKRRDRAVNRALNTIYDHMSQFYNVKGIARFKDKFQPAWEPRYLIHPGPASLPAVGIALIRADSGDDALWTFLRELRHDWRERQRDPEERPLVVKAPE